MKKSIIVTAALAIWAAGCSSGPTGPGGPGAKEPGKVGPTDSAGNAVTTAAANKCNTGLEAMAQHDKARDWSEASCRSTAPVAANGRSPRCLTQPPLSKSRAT